MTADEIVKDLSQRLTAAQISEMAAKLHIAAEAMIAEELGQGAEATKVHLVETSLLLAAAYGDAWGLNVSTGGCDAALMLNSLAEAHSKETIRDVAEQTCEGSA
ncbi:hypothetical protein SAMN04488527_101275 [Aliiroseovarius crassostreae]|uniref:Uncharacterized protein n=1 Tax=Aliiroseovarius crassostreae TaxID=154981 RepID=A0A0P7I4P5_9RHOB|nr:hypothetical protein [Aliiroseovarius crassostreae]KPN64272.1 hypothetical protein AKJ29_16700 [Aliiroseovarius crassostreae]SFU31432.1 hypothetical protein SAMN04488527_101275 [Aliiroseovarius crassostreae]